MARSISCDTGVAMVAESVEDVSLSWSSLSESVAPGLPPSSEYLSAMSTRLSRNAHPGIDGSSFVRHSEWRDDQTQSCWPRMLRVPALRELLSLNTRGNNSYGSWQSPNACIKLPAGSETWTWHLLKSMELSASRRTRPSSARRAKMVNQISPSSL